MELFSLSLSPEVPAGSPSRGGDVTDYVFDINQPSLPTPFLLCSCVCFCLYGPFHFISFHKVSRQLFAFSLCSGLNSALSVLSTIYFFVKVSFSPDIIRCDWLGLKHQITNSLQKTGLAGYVPYQKLKPLGKCHGAGQKEPVTKGTEWIPVFRTTDQR